MKYFYYILSIILLSACGNKKASIVDEIKKTKKEWAEAEMNRGAYSSAASRLQRYNLAAKASKDNANNKQLEKEAQIYKEHYESELRNLKSASKDILGDYKKLDSVAFIYETKTKDLKYKMDSLELELKKY